MKVNNVNNQNISYKALKISYNAEHKIRMADSQIINGLFQLGREHEANQYIDILVLKNLSCRIKEKANPFFCIKEPMNVTKLSDRKINIDAVYDGAEDEIYSKGDKFDIGIEFDTAEETENIISKYHKMKGLQKISFIAKLIENYFVKTKSEPRPTAGKRDAVITLLMDIYGGIVV